jgi:hypothetical protein
MTSTMNGVNGHTKEGKKDMSGFEFEIVDTKKSAWQMYKALTYVSKEEDVPILANKSSNFYADFRSVQSASSANRSPS